MEQNAGRHPKRSWLSLVLARGGWFAATCVVLGLALVCYGVSQVSDGMWMNWSGISTTGTVTGLAQIPRVCTGQGEMGDTQATCFDHALSFSFDAAGQPRSGVIQVGELVAKTYAIGQAIELRYLPDDPSVVALTGGYTFYVGIVLIVLGLGVIALGSLRLRERAQTTNFLVLARQAGVRRSARVLRQDYDVEDFSWVIVWCDEAGQFGRSEKQGRNRFPPVRSTITIYADPSGKLPSVWEGDSGPR